MISTIDRIMMYNWWGALTYGYANRITLDMYNKDALFLEEDKVYFLYLIRDTFKEKYSVKL
jgi:hypothetical protein